MTSVVISIGNIGASIHPSHGGFETLGFSGLALKSDVADPFWIKAGSCDPAETPTKGVVGIHHIPMAGGVRHAHRALFPIHVPLGDLHKIEYG